MKSGTFTVETDAVKSSISCQYNLILQSSYTSMEIIVDRLDLNNHLHLFTSAQNTNIELFHVVSVTALSCEHLISDVILICPCYFQQKIQRKQESFLPNLLGPESQWVGLIRDITPAELP